MKLISIQLRIIVCLVGFVFLAPRAHSGTVEIKQDQLWIDGQVQPQIFGAEVQYFRLRGGPGRNIPRDQVIKLWNQTLDHVVAAHMNAVSFYIPWDFHEYAEGKFDFSGTVDEDGDGNPDYPSRDILTFIRLIEEHGIKHILARPGPYINAEWGFLGFGAIPLWFHEKYPNSHALNSKGQRTSLYSYIDSDFLHYSQKWLEAVYHNVLAQNIGPGRPISFIQIDNETNFMWQSIFNHDYSPRSIQEYRSFLKSKHSSLENLNGKHIRMWSSWDVIQPPTQPKENIFEDQDWYRFQDLSLYEYLKQVRQVWTQLGVTEPQVLFTLAESFNATENGLLPNSQLRNSPEVGMLTVNLYPKTYETDARPLLNLPFKADHDIKAADSSNDFYLGRQEAWVMGPEIQGGWWRGIEVSEKARKQTYLTSLGHGLKALFVYYFNEGNNWQSDWMKKAITPYFLALKSEPEYFKLPNNELPYSFWQELDSRVANHFMVIDTRGVWNNGGTQPETLYFDAPISGYGQIRAPFSLLKSIGEKIIAPYKSFLGQAHELEDPVCIIENSEFNVPSPLPNINSRVVQSDWAGGLIALLMHAGINPRIHQWNLNPRADLFDTNKCKLIVYQDIGMSQTDFISTLISTLDQGTSVLSFISSDSVSRILALRPSSSCMQIPLSPMNVEGYQCRVGKGILYYARIPIYDVFNTDFYFLVHDVKERRGVIERILSETSILPRLKIEGGADRTVLFARTNPQEDQLWITVKTSLQDGFQGNIVWSEANSKQNYLVTNIFDGQFLQLSGARLKTEGFPSVLGFGDSAVYFVRPFNL